MKDEIDITELPIVSTREYWPPGSMEWRIQDFKDKFLSQKELPFPLPSDDVIREALEMLDQS